MEEVPGCDAEMSLGHKQLAELAVFVVLAAHQCGQSTTLALAEKVVEKFGRLFAAPVFDATEFWDVDVVEVHRLSEIEGCEGAIGDFPARNLIGYAEAVSVEIPCEILRLVDVEA